MIALIGSEGSMGKRYQAIFKYLGLECTPLDRALQHSEKHMVEIARQSERTVIATPTETHVDYLGKLIDSETRIMCEKPVTTDMLALSHVCSEFHKAGRSFQMVMQYSFLAWHITEKNKLSHYNYFRHGADGLKWDCFQIIALAKGPVKLREDSPIWSCSINGYNLKLSDMDMAYVGYMRWWLFEQIKHGLNWIQETHHKVDKFEVK